MRRSGIFLLAAASVTCVAVFLTVVSAQAPAAAGPRGTVAVCDVVTVFNDYQQAKDLSAEFQERAKKLAAQDELKLQAVQEVGKVLNALKPGSKSYEEQLQKWEKLSLERTMWRGVRDQVNLREHRRLTEEMYTEILAMIETVAKERRFDLVIHRENVELASQTTTELLNKIAQRKCLYAAKSIDITDVVLKRVNHRYRLRKK